MEPIDLIDFAKRSTCEGNAHIARTSVLPTCSRSFSITKGPSLPTLSGALSSEVPHELGEALKLPQGFHPLVDDHVPVQFWLFSGPHHCNAPRAFPVWVFVKSIDRNPDHGALAWSLFGRSNNADVFDSDMFIRGWFAPIGRKTLVPEDVRNMELTECIIVYNPRRGGGYLGQVAKAQALPACGVIKDHEVFHRVLHQRYLGGFVESRAPDGSTRWGRLSGYQDRWIELDAEKKDDAAWRYCERKKPVLLDLVGAEYVDQVGYKLLGDAFVCTDGTLLHTYHYTREEYRKIFFHSDNWKDGYYSNRLYPLGSSMIPESIVASFEQDMPAWFYKDDQARKNGLPIEET